MIAATKKPTKAHFPSLVNHFLIAMPNMHDSNFAGSLIYLCEHNERGAMGIVVNQSSTVSLGDLFERIDLELKITAGSYLPVMAGGPVQNDRGFVLHTPLGEWSASLKVNDTLALTTSKDILEAVVDGKGPAQWLVALGYAGWSAGQLDREITRNDWLTVPATTHVLFDTPLDRRLAVVYQQLGFDPLMLSASAGHA